MRAKMILESIEKTAFSEKLNFKAVYANSYPKDGKDEDNSFALFTPSATCMIQVNNPELIGTFKPGEKYYVDFTKAPY